MFYECVKVIIIVLKYLIYVLMKKKIELKFYVSEIMQDK